MKQYEKQNAFIFVISKWYDYNKVNGFTSSYITKIHAELEQLYQVQITFDSRYADAIHFSINLTLSVAFKQIERDQIDLETYFKIAQQLYKKKLISKRHLFDIKSIKPYDVVQKIANLIKIVTQGKITGTEIEQKWSAYFGFSLVEFWMFVKVKQVKHTILCELYKATKKAHIFTQHKQLEKYIINLQKDYYSQMLTQQKKLKISQFKEHQQNNQNLKNMSVLQKQQNRLINDENIRQSIKVMKPEVDHIIECQLRQISLQYSLYGNPKYRKILNNIQGFINQLYKSVQINNGFTLQTFGSLRSTLALSNQYDIDITFLSHKPEHHLRLNSINHLKSLERSIINKSFSWIKCSKVYDFWRVPIPFLKIEVDQKQFEKAFQIENTTKIDITIGNISAVMNSDLLLHYAKVPQIYNFCILIKLWAKSRNVIKLQHPMKGLSSYMLILMCIYYLMDSGQIDFLQASKSQLDNIEKQPIVPYLNRLQIKSIFENFKGFLQFYKQTGSFQKQRKVVCLLKAGVPEGYLLKSDIVVNAYDFIDKTNPGRLEMIWKDELFLAIERALKQLKSKSEEKIKKLFCLK